MVAYVILQIEVTDSEKPRQIPPNCHANRRKVWRQISCTRRKDASTRLSSSFLPWSGLSRFTMRPNIKRRRRFAGVRREETCSLLRASKAN
jgi:hypothetical protein